MTYRALKRRAIELRIRGYSYNLISEKLGISKSTLNGWLPGVPYQPNKEVIKRIGKARAYAGARMSKLKKDSIEQARAEALEEFGTFSKRDLFMLGIGLYIGEGAKYGSFIRVINSDSRTIALARQWFQEVCNIPLKNFSVRLHVYPDNDPLECKKYWSRETGIPFHQFTNVTIDTRKNKKMGKRGKLPYGTAHLSVKSMGNILHGAFLRRRIDAWMDIVLEKADVV